MDRWYDRDHLWLKPEDGAVVIGVTDYLQDAAGDVLHVRLPEPGSHVEAGTTLFSIEAAKWVGNFNAPVGGTVRAVNTAVVERPGLINRDPYGEGWLVRLAPDQPLPSPGGLPDATAPGGLMSGEEYERYVRALREDEVASG